ncbi:hypothetical protein AA21291_1710 [Swaminathania salitolerans LMG 21291]|uniref:PLOD1-3-like GT domain-containing protein n=1 Tax=Swaminathania salitolerans TaxID=182838 RepID=A0A511BS11_9PROT|nr:hypothetical protein AA21291_1710 [Swaminathania salitolerans LMG 21291]GEL02902.1 hypothetical protein SSA02_20650 [Swaminathania salitolerans]
MYHMTVCYPYGDNNHLQIRSEALGLRYINSPRLLNGDRDYKHIKKFVWIIHELESNELLRNSVVMFTDAHDIMVMANSQELCSLFYAFDCDFLISGESHFFPEPETEDRRLIRDYFHNDHPAPYPNAGAWIAYGWAALELLRESVAHAREIGSDDDQLAIQDVMVVNETLRIRVDHDNLVFKSVVGNIDNISIRGSSIFDENLRRIPVLHFNGNRHHLDFFRFYNDLFTLNRNPDLLLRVVETAAGAYVAYDEGRFALTEHRSPKILFLLSAPSGNSCLMTGDGRVVTISPEFNLAAGHHRVDGWEIIRTSNVQTVLQTFFPDETFAFLPLKTRDICDAHLRASTTNILEYFYNL